MILATAAMIVSCGGGNSPKVNHEEGAIDSVRNQEPVPVIQPENGVMQTMGKVVAERYADLAFETALPIEQVLVKNGQHVRRGQVLATLDQFKLRNAIVQKERAVEQAQLQIEQAHLKMQDVIIAQGYDPDKAAQIPSNVMHNADMKSG